MRCGAFDVLIPWGNWKLIGVENMQLRDPSLLKKDVCYVNGEWVAAKSGKTFKVNG
jgi:hypothetical protein